MEVSSCTVVCAGVVVSTFINHARCYARFSTTSLVVILNKLRRWKLVANHQGEFHHKDYKTEA